MRRCDCYDNMFDGRMSRREIWDRSAPKVSIVDRCNDLGQRCFPKKSNPSPLHSCPVRVSGQPPVNLGRNSFVRFLIILLLCCQRGSAISSCTPVGEISPVLVDLAGVSLGPGEDLEPAPFFLRMVAFAMDCIFIMFASLLAAQGFFPNQIKAGMETLGKYEEQFLELQNAQEEDTQESDKTPPAETSMNHSNGSSDDSGIKGDSTSVEPSTSNAKGDLLRELQERLESDPAVLEMFGIMALTLFCIGIFYWFIC